MHRLLHSLNRLGQPQRLVRAATPGRDGPTAPRFCGRSPAASRTGRSVAQPPTRTGEPVLRWTLPHRDLLAVRLVLLEPRSTSNRRTAFDGRRHPTRVSTSSPSDREAGAWTSSSPSRRRPLERLFRGPGSSRRRGDPPTSPRRPPPTANGSILIAENPLQAACLNHDHLPAGRSFDPQLSQLCLHLLGTALDLLGLFQESRRSLSNP